MACSLFEECKEIELSLIDPRRTLERQQELTGHDKEFGVYSKRNGRPLMGFNMILFMFQKVFLVQDVGEFARKQE